jgi:hypothetical protein
MKQFTLLRIEWNAWNGFFFHIVEIETDNWDRSLLSFWTDWDRKRIEIDILFIHFYIE